MGAVNKEIFFFANQFKNCFRVWVKYRMEEYVKLGIIGAITSEMVVARMVKINASKLELCAEVLKNSHTSFVLRIAISITSNKHCCFPYPWVQDFGCDNN